MPDFPRWLHVLAIASLSIAAACAITVALDEWHRPPRMAIMAAVWPITALFGGLLWLWAYYALGRAPDPGEGEAQGETPMPAAVLKGASHCGAGCTLGDIVAEWSGLAIPAIAVRFGYGSLFPERTFAMWVPDFILAYAFGIVFQYWAIKPMTDLSPPQVLVRALKADTASILSWQIGMYGAMAAIQFGLLRPAFGRIAPVNSPEFWFVMQVAMLAGFVTAYPVNWWLVRSGIKEKM